jgi:putative phosphoribosyl transferase
MGAIGEGGVRVLNPGVISKARVSDAELAAVEQRERVELERRAHRFRGGRAPARIAGRIAIVVDDGVATGSTARAACRIARAAGAARVVLAVPVAPRGWEERLGDDADELVVVDTPMFFAAIGDRYADFTQTSDEEVIACLDRLAAPPGDLMLPDDAIGVVVFSHGSGSSRHSPRNRFVAKALNDAGLGTLLLDLLTPEEEQDRRNVFDVELLGRRLAEATRRLRTLPRLQRLPVGYFGASTGAAAALWAAAEPDARIAAVVSRGGRPDLAGERLPQVTAPTLLVVGGHDETVLDLNRRAREQLCCEQDFVIVPGAGHLFEEPGALRRVADLARDWFTDHMAAVRR